MAYTDNWTYDEVRRKIITALEIERKDSVSLNVSRSDAENERDIVAWAQCMGYDAVRVPHSETVRVTRRKA